MQKSCIETLSVKNFRQFENLFVKFGEGFNFIAGPNGSGKTSILTCIAHCLTHSSLDFSRVTKESEYFIDVNHKDQFYRVGLGKGSLDGHGYRSAKIIKWNKAPTVNGRSTVALSDVSKDMPDFSPFFLGAQRSIRYVATQGMMREAALVERRNRQRGSSVKSIFEDSSSDVKQWLINRYFVAEKDWADTERKNWGHFITALPSLGPFDSNFSFVRIKSDMEPVFSIYGKECYLEELSSGFQAVLTIIARIIGWVEGTGEGKSAEIENAVGTVLIDEIDVHLHPEWQFTLRDGLRRLFPHLQFIVTTHSPHVLASAMAGEVIVMPAKLSGEVRVQVSSHGYSGWTTDQILTDVMGVRSLENKLYERLIHEGFNHVENKDIESLKFTIEKLRAVAHPDDAIVKVLEVRLAAISLS